MIVIVHQIFEGETSKWPVVEHRFFGETHEEARAVYMVHRKSDSFLRGCDDMKQWRSPKGAIVKCHSVVTVEKV